MTTDLKKLQKALVRNLKIRARMAETQAVRLAEELKQDKAMEQLYQAAALRGMCYEIEQMPDVRFKTWLEGLPRD